ncbi:MAG: ubiquinone anaerobic biosynthesis accessory factor UbiT [Thalassotalea sp.]
MAISFPEISHVLPTSITEKITKKLRENIELAPKRALVPFSLLPNSLQEKSLTTAINYLFKDELAAGELAFLLGKWLKITITDARYHCFISVNAMNSHHKCQVMLTSNIAEEVAFEAKSTSLLQLFSQTVDPDTLFFQRKLLITGNTELGLEIKNFLDDLDHESLPLIIKQALTSYKTLV